MDFRPDYTELAPESATRISDFVLGLSYDGLPDEVKHRARLHLLDLIGVAASSIRTPLSGIVRDHAVAMFGAGNRVARIMFDGRGASPAGAALAGGMSIDAVDAHDGEPPTKGHIGVAILPAQLACQDGGYKVDARGFLVNFVLGYEVSGRAGLALHGSVPDYHTSGAWNCLGAAAIGARVMGLDSDGLRHALGIAEYHGPRSQMMRCIDHPTMLKDGSGWGAMTGVSAADLAARGFTGAPAATIEMPDVAHHWNDLGRTWHMLDQYVKPYPVCRWAQPAVEAALAVQTAHGVDSTEIADIAVSTFFEATRLATCHPSDTEQAQYSLPYPVAAALVRGSLGVDEILGDALADAEIARVSDCVRLIDHQPYNDRFPRERWAHVVVTLKDGRELTSAPTRPRGEPDDPFSTEEMIAKFHTYAAPAVGDARARKLEELAMSLGEGSDLDALVEDCLTGL
ncbi:MAG: MmgE/PrpD family protein [Rhodospirillales bacterium]|nr:MmgE/PrpD family protein [Rhodospirillales bacterium]